MIKSENTNSSIRNKREEDSVTKSQTSEEKIYTKDNSMAIYWIPRTNGKFPCQKYWILNEHFTTENQNKTIQKLFGLRWRV